MRKPDFCLCENKGADQLRSNCEGGQRLCFRYRDSTISLLLKIRNFKLLSCFFDCTDRFVSDLVGNPEDRSSRVMAQIVQLDFKPQLKQISKDALKGSVPEIAQYGPYYLPLNVFTASKGSNLYILFNIFSA